MADNQLSAVLATLNSSDDSIHRALRILAVKFRNSDDDEAIEAIKTISESVNPTFNEKMRSRLASFENYCDREQLEPLLAKLTDQMTTFAGAMAAIEGFDIKWFRELAMSNSAKQQIAGTLIKLCQQYAHGSNDFWQKLVDGDSEILYDVSFDLFMPEKEDA